MTLTDMDKIIVDLTANQIESRIKHLTQGVTKYPEHNPVLDAIWAKCFEMFSLFPDFLF